MDFTTIKLPGTEALASLQHYQALYPTSGAYPFLIGDANDLQRLREGADFNKEDPAETIRRSLGLDTQNWIAKRRTEAEEYEFSVDDMLGAWPGEVSDKGSIGLHLDVLTRRIRPTVYLGIVRIEQPWQLPAMLKYGGWNDCPEAEVQCAFHRRWQADFGAQITGMSADVVECAVSQPPRDRETAVALAWQQYWYCADIVEQGCGSINQLAATLLNSPYWYFWWD